MNSVKVPSPLLRKKRLPPRELVTKRSYEAEVARIGPGRFSRTQTRSAHADAGLGGDILERAIPLVVIEDVFAQLIAEVDVIVAIAVVVADGQQAITVIVQVDPRISGPVHRAESPCSGAGLLRLIAEALHGLSLPGSSAPRFSEHFENHSPDDQDRGDDNNSTPRPAMSKDIGILPIKPA